MDQIHREMEQVFGQTNASEIEMEISEREMGEISNRTVNHFMTEKVETKLEKNPESQSVEKESSRLNSVITE